MVKVEYVVQKSKCYKELKDRVSFMKHKLRTSDELQQVLEGLTRVTTVSIDKFGFWTSSN